MAGESTIYKFYNDIFYYLCDVFDEAVTDSGWSMTENNKHTVFEWIQDIPFLKSSSDVH